MRVNAQLNSTTSLTPSLEALARAAAAQFAALSAEEKEAMLRRQREGWVRAEMAMGNDADEADYRRAMRGDTL